MHNQWLYQFLIGLNESYAQVWSQIIFMVPFPSINQAYSLLLQEESSRGMVSSINTESPLDTTFLYTSDKDNKPKKNWNLICDHCKMKGHEKKSCFKLVGYPPNFKKKKIIGGIQTSVNAVTTEEVVSSEKNSAFAQPTITSIKSWWDYWRESNHYKPKPIPQVLLYLLTLVTLHIIGFLTLGPSIMLLIIKIGLLISDFEWKYATYC